MINNSDLGVIFLDKRFSVNFLESKLAKSLFSQACLGSVAVYHAGLSNKLFHKKFDQKLSSDNYRAPVTRVQIPAQAPRSSDQTNHLHGPVTQPGRVSGF